MTEAQRNRAWGWCRDKFHANPSPEGLPLPRLELKWVRGAPRGRLLCKSTCIYALVIPTKDVDIRDDSKGCCVAVIGFTTTSSGPEFYLQTRDEGYDVEMPFRDGRHAEWDSSSLGGLPVFATYGPFYTKHEVKHG